MITLDSSVSNLSRVGEKNRKHLEALGIETCRDLIFYFPFRFDDFSRILPIHEVRENMTVTVHGKIAMIENRRSPFRRKMLTEALITDGTGELRIIWFNQPFLTKNLVVGDLISLSGKTNDNYLDLQLVSPVYEKVRPGAESLHTGRLVPVYSLTGKLSEKQFRLLMRAALDACLRYVIEWAPPELLEKEGLLGLSDALLNIHFPKDNTRAQQARERLSFDELFFHQSLGLWLRSQLHDQDAPPITFNEEKTKEWTAALPFTLTQKQKKVSWEIVQDCCRSTPMNRLVEGDVGSGKTVVSALAMYNVVLSGYQAALMAPTEILAHQHFETFQKLFLGTSLSLGLITSSQSKMMTVDGVEDMSRGAALTALQAGRIDIVIGTHALIEEAVHYDNLAYVVVDEQHRFGVSQRAALRAKRTDGCMPHLLSLTATPIPRTLALTVYGDLDISLLDETLEGRKKIVTKVVPAEYRQWTYDFIRKHIAEGQQAYLVCPLVDASDWLGARSVKEEARKLAKEVFPEFTIGMLHGKMKPKEKEETMARMVSGDIKILVASSVIEVGIDVPNATIIAIEGAERFGLAQLHQLRGRVGRSDQQSYCFLLPSDPLKEHAERLEALVSCANGFELAEKDLAMRGQGDVYGRMQSGMPALKIANLFDSALVKKARMWAEECMEHLDRYPAIAERVTAFRNEVHLE